MSVYPKQWRVVRPSVWPASPREMSVSLLHELEDCPRKWALEHASYPEIWNGYGYPDKIHMASLIGIITHSCVGKIIRELAKAGCCSIDDKKAIDVMRSLGGYTNIINSYIQIVMDSYQGNPRTHAVLDVIRSALLVYVADIRSKVQFLLGRMKLDEAGSTMNDGISSTSAHRQRSALPHGIHPEVDMRVPSMHWRGKADLIIITDSLCELIDFKTGEYDERYEFQMWAYALLWYRDSLLNPSSRLINKLTISYLREDVQVPVPTVELLRKFELEILERTKTVLKVLSVIPPKPLPSIEKCVFCDVRHLCEAYWKTKVNLEFIPEILKSNLADAEVTLTEQHSPLSWNVAVDAGPYLKSSISTLLRIPPNHHLVHSAQQGDRFRVLNAAIFFDPPQEPDLAILTLNNFSEAYAIVTED